LIACADFDAIVEALIRAIRKPQAQSLFRQLMVPEVMGEAQKSRHVTTTDLGGRFTDLAVELCGFFNDQYARFGAFALEHNRGRSAGKRSTDNCDIIIELHCALRE
jgi:hypothetical protein